MRCLSGGIQYRFGLQELCFHVSVAFEAAAREHDAAARADVALDTLAQDAHAAAGDRAHRELRMTRNAELADEEHVERRMQRFRDFESDRDTAARKSQHDDIVTVDVLGQRLGELASGFNTIFETHDESLFWCASATHMPACVGRVSVASGFRRTLCLSR